MTLMTPVPSLHHQLFAPASSCPVLSGHTTPWWEEADRCTGHADGTGPGLLECERSRLSLE